MHISDGILSPAWIMTWCIVALVFLAVGVRDISSIRLGGRGLEIFLKRLKG